MTDLVTPRTPGDGGRLDPGGSPGRTVPPPRAPVATVDGVTLTRLLALARPSAAQALEIAASVLADAEARAEPDAGGARAGRPLADRVLVGADGTVALGPAADGPPAAGPALGALLAGVADAARRSAPRAGAAPDPLLDELDRAAADLPKTGLPVVARRLQEAAAGTDRAVVRTELAALVRAVRAVGPPGVTRSTRAAVTRGAVAAPRPGAARRRRGWLRRTGAWVLSLVALAAVVLLEVSTLRDHIAADVREVLDAGRSGATSSAGPSATQRPDAPPVPSFAPASAGAVTGVDLRPLAACTPGAPCGLRVLARVLPAADPQVVGWSFRVVDGCTGTAWTAPGGTVTVPPGADSAVAVQSVPLPALPSVAVVAVTDVPAAAASPPVAVGSCGSGR